MLYSHYIGIDTGTHTGFALYVTKTKCLAEVKSIPIHRAMEQVLHLHNTGLNMLVRVEDARQRKYFGKRSHDKLQGAGSVKRDCTIWEDFLKDHKIPYEMVAPKNNRTKLDAQTFKSFTKYLGSTNEHGRDAAMLVFGY